MENLFSFICSSNNNIARITQMVEKLCVHFGPKIGTFQGQDYYGFPRVQDLTESGMCCHVGEWVKDFFSLSLCCCSYIPLLLLLI